MRVISIKGGKIVEAKISGPSTVSPSESGEVNKGLDTDLARAFDSDASIDANSSEPAIPVDSYNHGSNAQLDLLDSSDAKSSKQSGSSGKRRGHGNDYDHGRSAGKPLAEKPAKGSVEDVYNRAVYLLAMREHSHHELSAKLARKFPDSPHTDAVLDRLVDEGLQSDERFVESYVRSRSARGHGPQKIVAELRNKGVDGAIIDMHLNHDDDCWLEAAKDAYTKKFGASPVENYQDWAKRATFLKNRGFTRRQLDAAIPPY